MSKPNAHAILFGTDDSGSDEVTGLDEVLATAEAAFEADLEAGGDGTIDVDLTAQPEDDEPVEDEEVVEGEGDDAVDDGEEETSAVEEETETPTEAALRFANQQAAEEAHRAAEVAMHRAMWERDQAIARAEAAAAIPAPAPVSAPALDLSGMVDTNPVEAFNAALAADDPATVTRAIAKVDADSKTFAARAAMAADEGDAAAQAEWSQRAMNASSLLQEMRDIKSQAAADKRDAAVEARLSERLAPAEEDRFMRGASQAATKVFSGPIFEGVDMAAHDAAIGQYVQQYPQIMGGWTPAEMEAGFLTAAKNVVFGGEQGMIEHLVNQRIAAAATPKPKARGTAGGAARKAAPARPAAGSDEDDAEQVRASVGTGSRPNGMSVLFGS